MSPDKNRDKFLSAVADKMQDKTIYYFHLALPYTDPLQDPSIVNDEGMAGHVKQNFLN